METWHETGYLIPICPIDVPTRLQKIFLLQRNNWKILGEITHNQDSNEPINICHKANSEAEQKIAEIEGISDVAIGTGCHEIPGGTECSGTGGCTGIADCPYSEKFTYDNKRCPDRYCIPCRIREIEECKDEGDRRVTTDFEEEVANLCRSHVLYRANEWVDSISVSAR